MQGYESSTLPKNSLKATSLIVHAHLILTNLMVLIKESLINLFRKKRRNKAIRTSKVKSNNSKLVSFFLCRFRITITAFF